MHRDIARLLALLAVVQVVSTVACPAPAPLLIPDRGAEEPMTGYDTMSAFASQCFLVTLVAHHRV